MQGLYYIVIYYLDVSEQRLPVNIERIAICSSGTPYYISQIASVIGFCIAEPSATPDHMALDKLTSTRTLLSKSMWV